MFKDTINVIRIIDGTTVDGPGFRTSIYLAGCTHHCPGCHNPQSWDDKAGTDMTVAEIMCRIENNDLPVTLTGGDPLMHPDRLYPLLRQLSAKGINTWVYTGYTFEQLLDDPERRPLLQLIDVLVDGQFKLGQRDTALVFKGSDNQRLIDLRLSLGTEPPRPVLWESGF